MMVGHTREFELIALSIGVGIVLDFSSLMQNGTATR